MPVGLLESYELSHPAVPLAVDGLRILHLTDTHVRSFRPRGRHEELEELRAGLACTPVDLVLLTGDYMSRPGDERAALESLRWLSSSWRARLGAIGIFGNHDSYLFRDAVRTDPVLSERIRWLHNQMMGIEGLPLRVLGCGYPEDVFAPVLEGASGEPGHGGLGDGGLSGSSSEVGAQSARGSDDFIITLVHFPTEIFGAAALCLPLLLAGHTHGGQMRVGPRLAPHTSTDLPPNLASGLLRLDDTLCAISRGIGYAVVEARVNCPAQAPVYTLRRGPAPGAPARGVLTQVVAW